jgi:hypothetical protein
MAARVVVSHAFASVGMSLPWPLLLLLTWEASDNNLLLGLVGAARMLPYVLFSWAAGRPADRFRRDAIVRLTLMARLGFLTAMALAVLADQLVVAIGCATLAIAVATPAYPAFAAAMPDLAGPRRSQPATNALVTCEVASFVVGPAIGGLLISWPGLTLLLSIVFVAMGYLLLVGLRTEPPTARVADDQAELSYRALLANSRLRRAIGVVAVVNVVGAALTLALLPLAEVVWQGGETAYGLSTSAFGFGSLAGPLLVVLAQSDLARIRVGFLAMGFPLMLVLGLPNVWLALIPLLVVGAASVLVESAATGIIQTNAPKRACATVLGMADSAMVGAAMVTSLVSPLLAEWLGPLPFVGLVALVALIGLRLVVGEGNPADGPDDALDNVADLVTQAPGLATTPQVSTITGSRSFNG